MQHSKELIKGSKGLEMRSKCCGGENSNFKQSPKNENGLRTYINIHTHTHTHI